MKTKQEQIEAKKVKPIEIGDRVKITIPYEYTEDVVTGRGKKKVTTKETKEKTFVTEGNVLSIDKEIYKISLGSISIPMEINQILPSSYDNRSSKYCFCDKKYLSPTFNECGSNPFKKETFRVDFYNQDISSILFKACYAKRSESFEKPDYRDSTTKDGKTTYGGVNFNPFVIDKDGNKLFYQRDLVWTLEQKQLLIDSIYNGIEIGKFLFRYRSWKHIEDGMKNDGHGFSWDCVDGKQRFHAILHFVQNKFPDSYGNYWNDLNENAQRKILGYNKLSYGEMGETAKDSDVIETFLTMNFTGVPQSKEHLEFVKDIYSKI